MQNFDFPFKFFLQTKLKNLARMKSCLIQRWVFLTILLMFMISGLESTRTPNSANQTDHLSLLDFKNHIIDDPGEIMNSWNDSIPFCNWFGVTCNPSNGRIAILNLQSSRLVGSVPLSIGNLTSLTGINLQNNGFRGELPQEMGKLLLHRHINLSMNSFRGMIPTNLSHCVNLEVLDLISNKLTGQIPNELNPLSKMLYLGLATNNLTGIIPGWIGNFSSLIALSLALKNFHGGIPDELGALTRLLFFQLYGNQLNGTIPASIFNISSIYYFSVTENLLQGQLPSDVGLTLPNLQVFAAAVNFFTGHIPLSFANASRLRILDVSINALEGTVPRDLGRLRDLSRLYCDANRFGNGDVGDLDFVKFLANCTGLEVLGLAVNRFGGQIPQSIANLSSNLKIITLSSNLITGEIPAGIGKNLINLTRMDLDENYLTGSVPSEFGELQKLEGLSLNSNQLSGEIPHSMGNLTSLTRLFLQGNKLQGSIPPSLGSSQKLQVLNLSSNNLSGIIPKEVMGLSSLSISLAMAENSLTGLLPIEVGSLANLKELNLQGNMLTGKIPTTLGQCQDLESLLLNGNRFEGAIPESLGNLRGLAEIDLSSNNFSGPLPKFLGKLPILMKLNLSFNEFQGEVPKEGVFANASAVSVLGNDKLCGGVQGLQLPACSLISSSTRIGFSRKVVLPLVIVIVVLILLCALSGCYAARKLRKRPLAVSSTKYWQSGTSYQELFECTNGFSKDNLIGSGGFGSVYKGIIRADSAIVAVKVLNYQQKGASKTFIDEFNALKRIRHRNLLKILSACSTVDHHGNDFQCLVFKFMSNGNLDQWLHASDSTEPNMKKSLSIMQRLNIAIEVANALDYLQRDCQTPIAHCDLKPSNILLDDDMTAHVADFGLAKILCQSSDLSVSQSISVALKGSLGYIPPEYAMGGQPSTLGDVYSYGILLLELFTGKRPTDDSFEVGTTLHQLVSTALLEEVMDIVDPSLLLEDKEKYKDYEEYELDESVIINYDDSLVRARNRVEECIVSLMKIGVSCSNYLPSSRKPMYVVVNQMHSIRNAFLGTEA